MSVSIRKLQSDGETLPRLMKLQHDGRLLLEFDERYLIQAVHKRLAKKKIENSSSLNVIASLREGFHRIYTTLQVVLKY